MRIYCLLLLVLVLAADFPRHNAHAGQAQHVVVVVWDGMRPDYINAQYTPTLNELAKQGAFFKNHHSSYVTSTEVNGAALATGMFPDHSGIHANLQYRPEMSWLSTYGTESLDAIRRGDLLSGGRYLDATTLAEILQGAGIPTITAGAKPVVLLHDRGHRKETAAQRNSVTIFRGRTLPRSVLRSIEEVPAVGLFPKESAVPESTSARVLHTIKSARDKGLTWLNGKPVKPPQSHLVDAWTTRAVAHGLWNERIPKYTLVWLSEPDASQHQTGAGSASAEIAMTQCDQNLALLIKVLKEKGVFEQTDLLVMSDHGFSTVDRGPKVIASLKRANFIADKQFDNPEAGDIMVTSLGGSISFYVFAHEERTIRRLVEFLQESDFAGVIFCSLAVEGTFPLSRVRLDANHHAPDVLVSMRWSPDRNNWGAPGMVAVAEGTRGRGTHASLCPYDLHNFLIAAGPDFKQGFVSELPSGNVDLAPTVLAILGVPPPGAMDGRALTEALIGQEPVPLKSERETVKAVRELGFRVWNQYLTFSRVGSVIYFDEGNGESRLK